MLLFEQFRSQHGARTQDRDSLLVALCTLLHFPDSTWRFLGDADLSSDDEETGGKVVSLLAEHGVFVHVRGRELIAQQIQLPSIEFFAPTASSS